MSWTFPTYKPGAPIDWDELESMFDWFQAMRGVPQDPIWHAEGDVYVHTRMVMEALIDLPEFQELNEDEKHILFAAAMLHDVEKRSTTRKERIEGVPRIVSPGHAKKGEFTTRDILYRNIETPFWVREEIAKLVRLHGLPLWAIEKPDPRKAVIEASLVVDTRKLAMLARADILGRISEDREEMLLRVEMFEDLCKEHTCFGESYPFNSDYGRFEYLSKPDISPDYEPFDDLKFTVYVMSALPGSGKDFYIQKNLDLPVLSLDDLRREHRISPTDKKKNGQVIQMGKEKAREYMRARNSFVFNATNISSQMRGTWINLFVEYGARVKIIYLEVPFKKLLSQNKNREYVVPEEAMSKMMRKWEIPSYREAHEVIYEVG